MPQQFTCLQGHSWMARGEDPALDALREIICPLCGLTARGQGKLSGQDMPTEGFTAESVREASAQTPLSPPLHKRGTGGVDTGEEKHAAGEIDQVPGYQILGVLGRGGMGVVYRARQTALKRQVALKMVIAGQHASPEAFARFQYEAEAVARLQHPNIVQIYEVGQHGGLPYFSLEFVNAGSLAQFMGGTPQSARGTAKLMHDLARAVHYAHQRGIIHRDLKPANILLHIDESKLGQAAAQGTALRDLGAFTAKVSDFGLAKHMEQDESYTQTGAVMGTPSYMAPEQARGQTHKIGPAADVYSLGSILYDLLTGRPPFKAATALDTLQQVLNQEPIVPSKLQHKIPPDLETICLTCLQKDPAKRYASAEMLAEDLRRYLAHEPILARRAGVAERLVKWVKRRPALAALVGVTSLGAIVLLLGWAWFTVQLREERDVAQQEQKNAENNFRMALHAVDEMLTEVADEQLALEPRLEKKRRNLLVKALEFYEKFLEEKSDDLEVRKNTGVLYRKAGDLHRYLGSAAKAEQAYLKAIDLLGQLAEQFPDLPEYAVNLAESYTWRGELLRTTDQIARASESFRKAQQIQEKLAARYPREAGHRKDLARTFMNLGLVYKDTGQVKEALAALDQAVGILEELHGQNPRDPAYRRELAKCLLNIGPVQRRAGNELAAAHAFDRAVELLQALVVENSRDPEYRRELAVALNNRGNFQANRFQGRPEVNRQLAEKDHRRAADIWAQLVVDFSSVPSYAHEQANTLNSLAAVLVQQKNYSSAEAAWDQGQKIMQALVQSYPESTPYQGDLGMILGNLGWLKGIGKQPDWEQSRVYLEKAISQVQAALKPNPKNPDYQAALRSQYRDLARAQLALKDHDGAAESAVLLPTAYQQTKDDYFLAALLLARCLALATDDAKLDQDERKKIGLGYGDQALAMLQQARRKGFDQIERLKDSAFDPLRPHPIFVRLIQEITGKVP